MYVSMMGLGLVYILIYLGTLSSERYIYGIVSSFRNVADGSEIMLLSFLLSIVGGGFLNCAEEKYGYIIFEIQRVGVRTYTASKLLASVFGGFCTVIAGNLIYICAIVIHHFILFGTISFADENIEYLVWMCMFAALRAGVLSAIGFLVSTYVPNYYIVLTMLLLIYYAILSIQNWIPLILPMISSKFFFSKVYIILSNENYLSKFLFALLYTASILIIIHWMAEKRIERRLEYA